MKFSLRVEGSLPSKYEISSFEKCLILNFTFTEGWYLLICDNTELRTSSKIFFFSVSERHGWAAKGFVRQVVTRSCVRRKQLGKVQYILQVAAAYRRRCHKRRRKEKIAKRRVRGDVASYWGKDKPSRPLARRRCDAVRGHTGKWVSSNWYFVRISWIRMMFAT